MTTTIEISYSIKMAFALVMEELEIEMGDAMYRRRLREQYNKRHYYWAFLRLELHTYFLPKKYETTQPDFPEHSGCIYATVYIKPYSKLIPLTKEKRCELIMKCPVARHHMIDYYNRHHKLKGDKLKTKITDEEMATELNAQYWAMGSELKYEADNFITESSYNAMKHSSVYSPYIIKKRILRKTMNYKLTPRKYGDALNLKHWSKTTKNPTNKGLKADTTYTYHNGSVKGWTFGGWDADSLKKFAKVNGFVFEKGKKYQYGDYAKWVLHTLQ